MNSTAKGNELEDALYDYLIAEQLEGKPVYGVFQADRCIIRKKPKYPCPDRKKPVEFDVVIEVYREGGDKPFTYVVFECKNYKAGVPATRITDFSYYIGNVFGHSVKAVFVVTSRLQQGAEDIARSNKISIVKFIENGVHIIADRIEQQGSERNFVRSQIFEHERRVKSLKFAAYFDGHYYCSLRQLLQSLEGNIAEPAASAKRLSVPYMPVDEIRAFANEVLSGIHYKTGPVDLFAVCEAMSLNLRFNPTTVVDEDASIVLGSANFDENSIEINPHDNAYRERFTIAHEIGHFCLGHGLHLRSETVIEQDLLLDVQSVDGFDYMRLESQANLFASELLLPDRVFRHAADIACQKLGMRSNIGDYHVYVDDQPVNFMLYNELLSELSNYFLASKEAVEIRLKKLEIVNDRRKFGEASRAKSIGEIFSRS